MVKYYIGKRVLYEWFWTIKWICAIMLGFWVFYQGVWNRNKGTNIKISTKIDTDNNQESNIFSFGQNG